MRGARTVMILAVATLVAVGAVLFVERGPDTPKHGGETVFPALLDQVNSVERIRVTGGEETFTLARDGDAWVVEEKERYPADPDRVHRLLLGAAGMKRVEPKTSKPELYSKLWLEDPSGEDARSVRFALEDTSGAVLATWVLGNRRPSKSDASRTELYVRVADDPMAWLVEGSVPGGRETIDWLDREVARIDRERLRAVEVAHTDGAVVAVHRALPADDDFALRDIPAGREVDSRYRINDIGRFLEDLRFEDVTAASSLDFAGAPDKRAQVTTFDGLRIHIDSVMRDGDAWVKLRAELDETLTETSEGTTGTSGDGGGATSGDTGGTPEGEAGVAAEDAAGASEEEGGGTSEGAAEASDDATDAASGGASGSLHTADEVRAEAERLNARWQGWAYELPSFKRDYIAKRMNELTRALEETDEGVDRGGS